MTKYIFAYGSLINMKYSTQLDMYESKTVIPVSINNLQRHWIYCKNKKIYLGIRDMNNTITNGILFNVSDDEIKRLDLRETYYNRKELNKDSIIYNYGVNFDFKPDDIIYTYYPNLNVSIFWVFDKHNDHCNKYLTKCLSGCLKISYKFFVDFLLGTRGWKNN